MEPNFELDDIWGEERGAHFVHSDVVVVMALFVSVRRFHSNTKSRIVCLFSHFSAFWTTLKKAVYGHVSP